MGSMHADLRDELAAAIAAERATWEKVKDNLPGSPQHVEAQWLAWQAAVQRCRKARQALDAAGGWAQGSGGPPYKLS
jgi:hypothetical protein